MVELGFWVVGLIIMGRAPCCDERMSVKKGPWTPEEDQKLVAYIQEHGHGSWRELPEKAGKLRPASKSDEFFLA